MVPISEKLKRFNEQMDLFKNQIDSKNNISTEDYEKSMSKLLFFFLELDYDDQRVVFCTYFNTSRLVNVLVRENIEEVLSHLQDIENHENMCDANIQKEFHDLERLNQVEMIRLKIFLVKFFTISMFTTIVMFIGIIGLIGEWELFKSLLIPITDFFKVVGLVFK